ncbi:MAG: transcription termination/antitermination NusG family protein [Terrimicrobiaceae bacterium]
MRLPSKNMENVHWYCVKARPRQEQSAKFALANEAGLEVFCPMLRFERARKSGRVRVLEAMFPGYLFARFCYGEQYRLVRASNGVSTIVSFGGIPAIVPEAVIGELRASVADGETVEIPTNLSVGEEVQVVEGPFQGIRAIVTGVMPARARVTVLMELLGMEREVEVSEKAVLPDVLHPMAPR